MLRSPTLSDLSDMPDCISPTDVYISNNAGPAVTSNSCPQHATSSPCTDLAPGADDSGCFPGVDTSSDCGMPEVGGEQHGLFESIDSESEAEEDDCHPAEVVRREALAINATLAVSLSTNWNVGTH